MVIVRLHGDVYPYVRCAPHLRGDVNHLQHTGAVRSAGIIREHRGEIT